MIISILHASFPERPDLQAMLDRKMMILIPLFLNFPNQAAGQQFEAVAQTVSTALVQQRMCMTIQLTFDSLLTTRDDAAQTDDMLDQILCWLFERMTDDKAKDVVQIQAMETLSIQMKKADFQDRINMNFESLITQLAKANGNQKSLQIFDFHEEFIRNNYNHFTLDNLQVFIQSLVARVLADLNMIEEKRQKLTEQSEGGGKTLNLSQNKITKTQNP